MNIKPGMLCLVIGGRNAGRECTVIRRLKAGAHYIKGYGAETSLMPLANGGDDVIVKSEVSDYENCSTTS